MILPTEKYSFKLLTACFCGGADNTPGGPAEMRVPAIRGQIRLWQRTIGRRDVGTIWGTTDGEARASRVALFVDRPFASVPSRPSKLLPHCDQNSSSEEERRKGTSQRRALAAGESFTLTLQRLIGCSTGNWIAAQNGVKLWLLIGCLGLRANRAAGSAWPLDPDQEERKWVPQTPDQLGKTLRDLGFGWPVQLVGTLPGTTAEALRAVASNTVRIRKLFGEIRPRREPSPVKFKVIELAGQPRLLVTAPPSVSLTEAHTALSGASKAGQFQWNPL